MTNVGFHPAAELELRNAMTHYEQYELAVRRSIELGLEDVAAGRVTEVNEVRRQFRLPE